MEVWPLTSDPFGKAERFLKGHDERRGSSLECLLVTFLSPLSSLTELQAFWSLLASEGMKSYVILFGDKLPHKVLTANSS